jgi:hypothetical protein
MAIDLLKTKQTSTKKNEKPAATTQKFGSRPKRQHRMEYSKKKNFAFHSRKYMYIFIKKRNEHTKKKTVGILLISTSVEKRTKKITLSSYFIDYDDTNKRNHIKSFSSRCLCLPSCSATVVSLCRPPIIPPSRSTA